MEKLFSSLTEAFLITQCNCTSIGSSSAMKTNQWLGGGVERVYGYAARHSGYAASGYISGRFAVASQISSLQRRRPFLADSSLTSRFAVETTQQLDWTSCSDQLTDPVYPLPQSGDDLKEPHKRANFSAALLQMPLRHCKMR